MTRAKLGILAATIWASGFLSVGALAFSYAGPPRAAAVTATPSRHVAKQAVAAPPLAKIADHVVRVPKIVEAKPPPPPPRVVVVATPPPAVPKLNCRGWREIGPSASVRVCD